MFRTGFLLLVLFLLLVYVPYSYFISRDFNFAIILRQLIFRETLFSRF